MRIKLAIILAFFFTAYLLPQEGGKVSGQVFGDYFYTLQADSSMGAIPNVAAPGKEDSSGFQFRRITLNYDYTFSQAFFSRFRLEVDQQSNTANNRWGVFIKDAFLKWNNIFEGSDIIFGIQPTPSFEISEAGWGHRYLEKTILDLRGIESSRDFAVSLRGKFDASGIFNYWFMAGNGSGNSQESNKQKKLYGTFFVKPSDNLTLSLFADYAFRPEKSFVNQFNNNDAVTSALYIGYTNKANFNLGVESFIQVFNNDILTPNNTGFEVKARNVVGLTLFGTYNFTDKLGITARADYFDPNSSSDFKGDSRFFYIAALDYKPHPMVVISPNVLIETYENSVSGRSFDPSITARLTVSWIYR